MTEKMPALFAVHPPKSNLSTLDEIVDDWIFRFGKKGVQRERRDEVVELCAKARSFPDAVHKACASRRPNGKMHNHQSRVPEAVRQRFAEAIIKTVKHVQSFDDLYDKLEALHVDGIGPVTCYDVATRIAAYFKIEVQSLYLHAGVRIGWCLLHGVRGPRYEFRMPRSELPRQLRRLPTDEIEDFLCAYRSFFKPWLKANA